MQISWSTEETHAKQLKILTNPVNDPSYDIIPVEESGMIFLLLSISKEIFWKQKSRNWL